MLRRKKFSLEIIKNNIKFELRNYEIYKDLLYINDKLYIPNNLKLYIEIIKLVHDTLFNEYVNKLFIYN